MNAAAGVLAIALLGLVQDRPAGPLVSPEVLSDRRVTFRLRAPQAQKVQLAGEWGGPPQAMTKDDQGVWSLTVGPLEPDVWGYNFLLDGFAIPDPANAALKPMRSPRTSVLEVPGDPPRLHEFQKVPHGTVRLHEYESKALGRRRPLRVYTPPGYDRAADTRYPVLYLFHGSGDNEATWTSFGHAHWIADNLIAQGKAKPMILVMPDGHAVVGPEAREKNLPGFVEDLIGDVIPWVESNYRVLADPAHRGIVGLSMGGGQSLVGGLNHLELFAWVGGFSAAIRDPETTVASALADPAKTNARLRLLYLACGKDDRLVDNAKTLSQALTQREIRHDLRITEGNHSWPVWRKYLADFLPLLFLESK
ncbi:MAG TPA: alpha/beta hydrolase-fold protein [Planctomycetota bacterium]|nr:alpha/beta hydrolase-fold protein [Planctomycetota bacterium]